MSSTLPLESNFLGIIPLYFYVIYDFLRVNLFTIIKVYFLMNILFTILLMFYPEYLFKLYNYNFIMNLADNNTSDNNNTGDNNTNKNENSDQPRIPRSNTYKSIEEQIHHDIQKYTEELSKLDPKSKEYALVLDQRETCIDSLSLMADRPMLRETKHVPEISDHKRMGENDVTGQSSKRRD